MQVTCAALGLLSSVAAWLAGATFWWLVGGVVLGAVIPFTLIAILPTNKQLLSPTLDRRSAETERLLARWGRLHTVRSVLSAVALLLFLYLARSSRSLCENLTLLRSSTVLNRAIAFTESRSSSCWLQSLDSCSRFGVSRSETISPRETPCREPPITCSS